jgi:hypothetical protein
MKAKIDPTELEAFRQTLPKDLQEECFCYFSTQYDVCKALFIITKKNLATGTINVKEWCQALGMAGERNDEAIHILNGVMDKEAMADQINPEHPIIIAEHTYGKGKKMKRVPLVIDGNKRLRKAFLTNLETIKAYYLPMTLAHKVRQ